MLQAHTYVYVIRIIAVSYCNFFHLMMYQILGPGSVGSGVWPYQVNPDLVKFSARFAESVQCIRLITAETDSQSTSVISELVMTLSDCDLRNVLQIFFLFFFCLFFCFFFCPSKNTRQPFSGMAERIFMKLLPNNSGENVVSNIVPKWGLGPQIIFFGAKNYTLRTCKQSPIQVVTTNQWIKFRFCTAAHTCSP